MSYFGRKLRLSRLLYPEQSAGLIVPIDHGLTVGPIKGIESTQAIQSWVSNANISAIIAHKGMIEKLILADAIPSSTGVMVHLNGMNSLFEDADTKQLVTDLAYAVQLGADAVSIQVNFTESNAAHNTRLLGAVADKAHALGIPLLSMVYDKANAQGIEAVDRMRSFIRMGVELGSDALKIGFPEKDEYLPDLLSASDDGTPIFFAGGEKGDENILLHKAQSAMEYGAKGLCIGRGVFQSDNKDFLLSRLAKVLRNTPCASQPSMSVVDEQESVSYAG
ncbi:aldolase [Pseudoalteromonas sp. PS5]|uniref:class I fructose-bisphosphate aldolase n=1 Tax=Pseudoalteromonas sp. PS5 TaxID=1437473 RepID=UPI000FFE7680|nr:aldolase [Pseudoalteromonas sp. PS5]RXE97797.1 aldolase [Pseudoalteromonas sp. PS5]